MTLDYTAMYDMFARQYVIKLPEYPALRNAALIPPLTSESRLRGRKCSS